MPLIDAVAVAIYRTRLSPAALWVPELRAQPVTCSFVCGR